MDIERDSADPAPADSASGTEPQSPVFAATIDLLSRYIDPAIPREDLVGLMHQVNEAVIAMFQRSVAAEAGVPRPQPAAPVAVSSPQTSAAAPLPATAADEAPVPAVSETPSRPPEPVIPEEDVVRRPDGSIDLYESSVKPEYLVCLEDGQRKQMIKRYLKTHFGLEPEQYKKKWGLPARYPMASESYSQKKKLQAHRDGLGSKEHKTSGARKAAEAASTASAAAPQPAARGRRTKAQAEAMSPAPAVQEPPKKRRTLHLNFAKD